MRKFACRNTQVSGDVRKYLTPFATVVNVVSDCYLVSGGLQKREAKSLSV